MKLANYKQIRADGKRDDRGIGVPNLTGTWIEDESYLEVSLALTLFNLEILPRNKSFKIICIGGYSKILVISDGVLLLTLHIVDNSQFAGAKQPHERG